MRRINKYGERRKDERRGEEGKGKRRGDLEVMK